MTSTSREKYYAARLAVMHVLHTLKVDPYVASRILADMTNDQLIDLVEAAEGLAERGRGHLQSRGVSM